jgi:hypothetical protein
MDKVQKYNSFKCQINQKNTNSVHCRHKKNFRMPKDKTLQVLILPVKAKVKFFHCLINMP